MKEYQLHGLRALAQSPKGTVPAFLQAPATQGAWRFHHALEDYGPTPLVRLNGLAEELGLGGVFVKDESHRFGLNAFKGLGGIYALSRAVARELGLPAEVTLEELQAPSVQKEVRNMVFVTTTDGNHGRGVAWAARKLGCEAHVYLPAGSAPARAQAILDAGAVEARVLPLGYDDAVRYAAQQAQEKGWTLIQDTSWPGYEEIPTWIVQGYTTLAREAADQLAEAGVDRPTHVFLQAGVGAMAGGVLGYLADRYGAQAPVFAVVEPENVAGIYASAQAGDGQPHPAQGPGETIMAGQHCAERRRGQIEPQPPGMPEADRQRAQHSQHKQRVPLRQTNRRKRQCGAAPYQPEQPLEPETQHEGRQVRDCRQKRHSAAYQQQDAQLQGGLDHPDDQQVAEHPDQAGRHAVGHQHRQRGKAGKHCRLHRLCHLA